MSEKPSGNSLLPARREAIEVAINRYDKMVVRWLTQKFGEAETAQDIAQNTYLRVWRFAENHEVSNPKALIFKTAANLAMNEFRARKRARFISASSSEPDRALLESVASDSPSPERSTADKQDLAVIMRAIASLPIKARRAFILSRFMGKKLPRDCCRNQSF